MGMVSRAMAHRGAFGRGGAAALILAAVLVPAGAGPAAATGSGPRVRHVEDGNWGGYVARGSFGGISGRWTEPSVACTSTDDLFAPWVGLDGYGSGTVEQTGVQTDCSSGRPVLSAWYEMYPAAPVHWNDPVAEGDSITASVASDGSGGYTLTLSDTSQGWSEHVHRRLGADNASAEAVIEAPTGDYPSFDRLTFSDVTVDGRPFADSHPGALTAGGYGPGPLSGGSFSMTPDAGSVRAGAHPGPHRAGPIRY